MRIGTKGTILALVASLSLVACSDRFTAKAPGSQPPQTKVSALQAQISTGSLCVVDENSKGINASQLIVHTYQKDGKGLIHLYDGSVSPVSQERVTPFNWVLQESELTRFNEQANSSAQSTLSPVEFTPGEETVALWKGAVKAGAQACVQFNDSTKLIFVLCPCDSSKVSEAQK